MKKFLCIICLLPFLFSQEVVLQKVKIDKRTESLLVTIFETKPKNVALYLTKDSTYVVEADYDDKKVIKKLTIDEYNVLLETKLEKVIILENTRVPYLIGQTSLGIFLYSWSLPIAVGGEDCYENKGFVALGLFTPLLWTITAYNISRNANISGGAAYASFLGGIEGAFHGGFIFDSPRTICPVSVVENAVNFMLAQKFGFTPGMYQRKFNHSIYGYYHYFVFTHLAGMYEDVSFQTHIRNASIVSLFEGYTSLYLFRKSEYLTYGDALFELRTSIIGAQTIPLILASIDLHRDEASDEKIYVITSLAGFSAGYYIGNKLSKGHDLSGPSAFLTYLLPYLAHGLTGGLTVLFESDGFTYSYPIIFSISEIGLTYFAYKKFAKKDVGSTHFEKGSFNFFVNPLCLLAKEEINNKLPLLAISYSF